MKNHRKVAIALEYNGISTPIVSVIGKSQFAEEVEKRARRYGVPVRENTKLVQQLAKLEAKDQIPQHLYHVVADLLCGLEE